MKSKNQPASITDVTRAFTAVQSRVKKLVKLLGDPDDAIASEACTALIAVGPLAAEPLAAAILRPISDLHRVKAIFTVQVIRPRNSPVVQKALRRVAKQEENPRLAEIASTLMSELILDEMEDLATAAHRKRFGPAQRGLLLGTPRTGPEDTFMSARLSALDTED